MNKISKKISRSAIIILGASGDLAKRKLIPALSKLYENGEIDSSSIVVGSGRSEFSDQAFRARFDVCGGFADILYYYRGINGLKKFLSGKGVYERIIFFMALPPAAYASTSKELAAEGFGKETTLIIEKPFGYDYDSARTLNTALTSNFNESQIFRIDHYLAKEAIQNILVFRFANFLFSQVWSSRYIESIQINAFEEIGVEDRGAYFDGAGIIRDMIQNHLTQLLCLLTMEAPVSLDAEEIRAQKINVLKSLRVSNCCRFQYKGYHEEKGVAPDSRTETFAEMKMFIDNFRWYGMPVHIRTGKALDRKGTEIGVTFKPLPKVLFNADSGISPNRIIFKIQPSEGIIVDISSKIPGGEMRVADTGMSFCYRDTFNTEIPEAYQKLLLDALKGDRTLFVSAEETEISWKKFEPFLNTGSELKYYEKGVAPKPCLVKEWIDFARYKSVCE